MDADDELEYDDDPLTEKELRFLDEVESAANTGLNFVNIYLFILVPTILFFKMYQTLHLHSPRPLWHPALLKQ